MVFPHLYILNASAGTGKTRQLSLRYIKFLLSQRPNSDIKNILAITFTNKAANEMRERILDMLKNIALKTSYSQSILKELGIKDLEKASKIACRKIEEIILNYSDFYVKTIDSFVNSLLLASAFYLKLPPYAEILQDSQEFLEFILDELLETLNRDQNVFKLFKEFLRFYLEVEDKPSWYPKKDMLNIFIQFHNQENIRAKDIKTLFLEKDFLSLEKEIKEKIKEILSYIYEKNIFVEKKIIKLFEEALSFSFKEFLKSLKKIFDRLSTINLPQELEKKIKELKRLCSEYVDNFCLQRFNPYINIYKKFCEHLEEFKFKKKIIFLEELNKKANQFLKGDPAFIPEIYYRLSAVFYHFLIDEFQDTSILQWMNIFPLIDEAISKGGSLFYVGDRKQAIYRFRGGQAELFEEVKDYFKNRVEKIISKSLTKNFRSKENIVKFNNSIFNVKNLKTFLDNLELEQTYKNKLLEFYSDSEQEVLDTQDKKGGYVYLEQISAKDFQEYKDLVKEKLKELIEELEKRYLYSEIGILLRKNEDVREITEFLLELKKPVSSEQTLNIKENYLIREIISFLNFLLNNSDDLSFANFILGDIFLKESKLEFSELKRWLYKRERSVPLYKNFSKDFPSIWKKYIEEFLINYKILPLYDLLDLFFKKFKLLENFPTQEAFFMHFLELAKNKEDKINNLRDFLEEWEKIPLEELLLKISENLKGIRVMTIHKAKGLEFKVVILPQVTIDTQFYRKTQNRIFKETESSLHLISISKNFSELSSNIKKEYQKEYFYNILDELNTLYVAFTRASDELYAFFPKNIGRTKNVGIELFFKGKEKIELGEKSKRRPVEKEAPQEFIPKISDKPKIFSVNQIRLKDQLKSPQEVIKEINNENKLRGEIFHYILAHIKQIPSDYQKFLEDLVSQVCRIFSYSDSKGILSVLLKNFENQRFKDFFTMRAKIFTEKEITDKKGNLKRVDRLMITPKKIILIDFKSGENFSPEHLTQIKEYVDILKEIYPQQKITPYLIYLETATVKEVLI